jgi:hypothetical protein
MLLKNWPLVRNSPGEGDIDEDLCGYQERGNKSDEVFHRYTADGVKFRKTTKISDIPVNAGDELYVDVIPVELTDGFLEVLRRGVKVFYLRRLALISIKREELGLPKTSRNDLRALMKNRV